MVLTLGCDKNTVDSERIMAELAAAGAEPVSDPATARLVVVNTCGFIDIAKEESVDALLEAAGLKGDGCVECVVAVGCLVERYQEELRAELPEVDLFLGLCQVGMLVPELRSRGMLPQAPMETGEEAAPVSLPSRFQLTPTHHSSYLKIGEGCDHRCTFCAIPRIRGGNRSVPVDLLVQEALELERRGVVELNLISQDITQYGWDLTEDASHRPGGDGFFCGHKQRPDALLPRFSAAKGGDRGAGESAGLVELLRALLQRTGIPWLRLLYAHPAGISPHLVELMATEPRILPYLDMPIQHASDTVLTRMGRRERQGMIRDLVAFIREAVPGVVLRTTVLVGFPGETEEDFDVLLDFLQEVRFQRVGAFQYSPEEGTRAAGMRDQVPEEVRRERVARLQDLQTSISLEYNQDRIGEVVDVLVDSVNPVDSAGSADLADPVALVEEAGAVGRTAGQAPEVDGQCSLESDMALRSGQFVRARIIDAQDVDLSAEVEELYE